MKTALKVKNCSKGQKARSLRLTEEIIMGLFIRGFYDNTLEGMKTPGLCVGTQLAPPRLPLDFLERQERRRPVTAQVGTHRLSLVKSLTGQKGKMCNIKFHVLLDASERQAHLVTGKHTSTAPSRTGPRPCWWQQGLGRVRGHLLPGQLGFLYGFIG